MMGNHQEPVSPPVAGLAHPSGSRSASGMPTIRPIYTANGLFELGVFCSLDSGDAVYDGELEQYPNGECQFLEHCLPSGRAPFGYPALFLTFLLHAGWKIAFVAWVWKSQYASFVSAQYRSVASATVAWNPSLRPSLTLATDGWADRRAGLIAPEMRYTPLPHAFLQGLFLPRPMQFITTSTYRRARTGNSKSDLGEGNAEMLLSLRGISMTVWADGH